MSLSLFTALISCCSTLLYVVLGIGVAGLTAERRPRPVRVVDVPLWPVVLVIFAILHDVQ